MTQRAASTGRTSREAESFFAEIDKPSKRFLKEEEKLQLTDEAIPFTVTELDFSGSKQYGDRWELTITPSEGEPFPFEIEGEPRIVLTLPSHGARDYIMRKLEKAVQAGPVGPLLLTSSEIDDGKTWLALKRAEKA